MLYPSPKDSVCHLFGNFVRDLIDDVDIFLVLFIVHSQIKSLNKFLELSLTTYHSLPVSLILGKMSPQALYFIPLL